MLEDWQDNCKPGFTMDISRNTSMTSNEEASRLAYKLVRVEGDVTLAPALEDELMEVEHLFTEPKHEKVSVDGLLCFDIENPEKCLAIDDFPVSVDHNQIKIDNGMFGSTATRDWSEESKLEFLDKMLQDVDEEYLHESNGLSSACDDYLLDYAPCEGSGSGNLGFESHFTDLSEQEPGGAAKLELLPTTAPLPESKSDQNDLLLDKMTIHELHEAFRSTFGRETLVKDKQWLIHRISSRVHNLVQSEDVMGFLESGISVRENGGGVRITSWNDSPRVFCSSTLDLSNKVKPVNRDLSNKVKPVNRSVVRERLVGVDVSKTISSKAGGIAFGLLNSRDKEDASSTRKRLRKPTRRYIEESSDMRSRHCSRSLESPVSNSRTKYMLSRSYNQHQTKGSDLPRRKKHRKTNASIWNDDPGDKSDRLVSDPDTNSDLEPSPAESYDDMSDESDDCALTKRKVKSGSRRKHHRLWSLSEVMTLIDGVSQYGVGRWTDIKRLLFSSSVHRTSVDLKDKWRNLLRASGTQIKKRREVEQGRKSPSLPIPLSVLQRVSELAIIYPYPRDRKFKLTRSSHVATPIPVAASGDTTISQSGKTLRGKSVT